MVEVALEEMNLPMVLVVVVVVVNVDARRRRKDSDEVARAQVTRLVNMRRDLDDARDGAAVPAASPTTPGPIQDL